MPRGYLKHEKGISRKQGRGGSSFRPSKKQSEERNPKLRRRRDVTEDFCVSAPRSKNTTLSLEDTTNEQIAECVICFEIRPLFNLSQKCEWHGAACRKCLRRIYVKNAPKSVDNYPLRCFHPACDQCIRGSQLHHIYSPEDFKKHRDMMAVSRNLSRIKSNGLRTISCPSCQSPVGVSKHMTRDKRVLCYMCKIKFVARPDYKSMGLKTIICPTCDMSSGIPEVPSKDMTLSCKHCQKKCFITPDYATIRAMENLSSDTLGPNYGWAKCPHCSILISKGEGCNRVVCGYCKSSFNFGIAKRKVALLARIPDSEIHLWW